MPELKKFDYFYLRYSPYPMMDDYVTFGVVLLEAVPTGFADVYFSKNYRRLQCFHDDVDLDYFNFLENDIRDHLRSGVKSDELLAKMHDCFGNAVRISPYRECLAEDGAAAIELLARGAIDLPTHPQPPKQEPRGRRRIFRKIQNAFEAAGIWDMVFKNVPVSDYTYPGDPLKSDVSYRLKDRVKMLQAVSLQSNIDGAKALSFSYPQLVAGIKRKENAGAELTAIVEDDLDRNRPEIGYALGTMERTGINVAIASELPIIAEKARAELMA
jgi:hypothetical protein